MVRLLAWLGVIGLEGKPLVGVDSSDTAAWITLDVPYARRELAADFVARLIDVFAQASGEPLRFYRTTDDPRCRVSGPVAVPSNAAAPIAALEYLEHFDCWIFASGDDVVHVNCTVDQGFLNASIVVSAGERYRGAAEALAVAFQDELER